MPKNLDAKINLLLDDLETASREEFRRRFIRFVEDEVAFHEVEVLIDEFDLIEITSKAVSAIANTSYGPNSKFTDISKLRAWAYSSAVNSFLKHRGLVKFILRYNHSKK
jgi:hypothetical protein